VTGSRGGRPGVVRAAHRILAAAGLLATYPLQARALERFPPPEFESYKIPVTTVPGAPGLFYEYVDVAALLVALAAASYFAIRRRSRAGLLGTSLASLAYFGLWRKGCVCPIGAIQNVALTLADPSETLPAAVAAFFFLPILFTLAFGRTFCASVCPLGAIQDIVVVKPVAVPRPLEHALGLLAYVYLGAGVLFAATGSAFLFCRYDPFVSFFRLSGSAGMLALGVSFLAAGMFVGRPYCRYACPYGALLRLASWASRWHARIAPGECDQCRLCEESCPFAAILPPSPAERPRNRREGMDLLAGLVALVPALVAIGAFGGLGLGSAFSRMHATVRLSDRVALEDSGVVKGTTDASEAFRKTGRAAAELHAEAATVVRKVTAGAAVFGGFVGLVLGLKLVSLSVKRTRTGYEPDRVKCVSCGRCFMSCPRERERLGLLPVAERPPRSAKEEVVVTEGAALGR